MEVSRSGYYDYLQRRAKGPVGGQELDLIAYVKGIHEKTRGRYGSRRRVKQLQDEGVAVGHYPANV